MKRLRRREAGFDQASRRYERSSRGELCKKVLTALNAMLEQGTSVVEAKSGYGLTLEDEVKSLEAIRDAARQWPGEVIPTLLAAHVVPQEYAGKADDYVKLVCDEMIPLVAKKKLAKYVDVFCDRGRVHAGAIGKSPCSSSQTWLGDARTCMPVHGGEASAAAGISACVVRSHGLRAAGRCFAAGARRDGRSPAAGSKLFPWPQRFPDARRLIDAGVPLALATDYNPGTSPTPSMPFVISLACTHMKLTPAEAIAAATINAACALRLQDRKGSLEAGKDADLAVFDVKDYREIAYWFAWDRCVEMVVAGRVVGLSA